MESRAALRENCWRECLVLGPRQGAPRLPRSREAEVREPGARYQQGRLQNVGDGRLTLLPRRDNLRFHTVRRRLMTNMLLGTVAVLFCSASSACGESASFDLTVAAGRYERKNVPVRVQLPPGQIGDARIASLTLTLPDGDAIPAQWTGPGLISGDGGEIHFILPHLAVGQSVRLRATPSTDPSSGTRGFAWHDHPGHHADLFFSKRPVVTYHYERLDESSPASRVRTY